MIVLKTLPLTNQTWRRKRRRNELRLASYRSVSSHNRCSGFGVFRAALHCPVPLCRTVWMGHCRGDRVCPTCVVSKPVYCCRWPAHLQTRGEKKSRATTTIFASHRIHQAIFSPQKKELS